MDEFEIFATDGTKEIIEETLKALQAEAYEQLLKDFTERTANQTGQAVVETGGQLLMHHLIVNTVKINHLGRAFRGVVKLAAMVAKNEIGRVLFFQDPKDLEMGRPENYALLRNCNLHGKKLYLNEAANLWAEYKAQGLPPRIRTSEKDGLDETVAYIAHDSEKDRMARFVVEHRGRLLNFRKHIATSRTREIIELHLKGIDGGLVIKPVWESKENAHGPLGGDVIIADQIYDLLSVFEKQMKEPKPIDGPFYHILFFMDHKQTQPHEPDIQALLKTCVDPILRVNLILNKQMADEWIQRYQTAPMAQAVAAG